MAKDPVESVLEDGNAPWYMKLGWKLKKGAILKTLLTFLDNKLGKGWKRAAFGVAFIGVLIAKSAELLFGWHIPVLDSFLNVVSEYLATENPDAPVTLPEAQQNLGVVITAITTGIVGLITLLHTTLHWAFGKKEPTKK